MMLGVGVLVTVLYGAIWLWWRPAAFVVSGAGLELRFPGRRGRVPASGVTAARRIDAAVRTEDWESLVPGTPVGVSIQLWRRSLEASVQATSQLEISARVGRTFTSSFFSCSSRSTSARKAMYFCFLSS